MKIGTKLNKPSSFNDRLKAIMGKRNISQAELVRRTGIPKSAMSQYVSGAFEPKGDRITLLADALGVSEAWLCGYKSPMRRPREKEFEYYDDGVSCSEVENPVMTDIYEYLDTLSQEELEAELEYLKANDTAENGIRPIRTKKLPLLGNVACGEPIFAEESFDAYVSVGSDVEADFCLRAKGDSMINARIFDGDILFVKSQPMVDDGEIAVVLIEDEATVKRVYYDRENNTITLVPENPTYKVMRFMGEQLNQIRILGKVIAGQYDVR